MPLSLWKIARRPGGRTFTAVSVMPIQSLAKAPSSMSCAARQAIFVGARFAVVLQPQDTGASGWMSILNPFGAVSQTRPALSRSPSTRRPTPHPFDRHIHAFAEGRDLRHQTSRQPGHEKRFVDGRGEGSGERLDHRYGRSLRLLTLPPNGTPARAGGSSWPLAMVNPPEGRRRG